jgi:hypothetical protein
LDYDSLFDLLANTPEGYSIHIINVHWLTLLTCKSEIMLE